MGKDHPAIDTDLLLSQTRWVHSFSRSLVRDPLVAEDVAQETLLAALASPPRYAENVQQLRAWLSRVAFNLAHRVRRKNSRRIAREVRVARSEELGSTVDDVVRRTELRRVTDAVAALDEPYRTAVVQYYFWRRSTAEIARETGTTDNAVRKRLWRARAQLRVHLDGGAAQPEGGRPAATTFGWFAALLPAAWRRRLAGPSTGEQAARSLSLGAHAQALLACAASLALLVPLVREGRAPRDAARFEPRPAPTTARLRPLSLAAVPRVAVAGATPASATDPLPGEPEVGSDPPPRRVPGAGVTPGEEGQLLRGRVLDLAGRGVGGLFLGRPAADGVEGPALVTTDEEGRFAAPPEDAPLLGVLDPDWFPLPSLHPARAAEESWLLVAPAAPAFGVVVDERGNPLPDAELALEARPHALARWPFGPAGALAGDLAHDLPRSARSDATGAFRLERVPLGPGFVLTAHLAGHGTTEVELLGAASAHALVLRLVERAPETRALLRGVVLSDDELPLADAEVSLGAARTRTDAAGRFELPIDETSAGDDLLVAKAGFLPVRRQAFGALLTGRTQSAGPVRFFLGTQPFELSGRVLARDGRPAVGWQVAVSSPAEGLESLTAGAGSLPAPGRPTPVATDASGRFVLGDLAGRSYLVQAWDPRGTARAEARWAEAGTSGLVLAASASTPRPGPTSEATRPAAHASTARAHALAPRLVAVVPPLGPGLVDTSDPTVWTQTGRPSPRTGARAHAGDSGSKARREGLLSGDPDSGDPGALDLEAARPDRFTLRVLAATSPETRAVLRVVDAAGGELALATGVLPPTREVELVAGASPRVELACTATELILLEDGREVRRLHVAPEPGEFLLARL